MLRKTLIPLVLLCVGCSTQSHINVQEDESISNLENIQCDSADDLKGIGFAENYDKTFLYAVSEISQQINSSVVAINQSKKTSYRNSAGQEQLSVEYSTNTTIATNIENVQDIYIAKKVNRASGVAVVACMKRSDAVKPFWPKYDAAANAISRQLEEYKADEPKRKIAAINAADSLYPEFFYYGAFVKSIFPTEPRFNSIKQQYSDMQEDFSHFQAEYEMFVRSNKENDFYSDFIKTIAQTYNVKKAPIQCQYGILINLNQKDHYCDDSSVGTKCTVPIEIEIETCSGKKVYNTLTKVSAMIDRPDFESDVERSIQKRAKLQVPTELLEILQDWVLK